MRRILAALFLMLFMCSLNAFAQLLRPLPRSGSQTWGDWSFRWNVGDKSEGLELRDVRFKGISVIFKASLPVVRVKYRGGGGSLDAGCGPWTDRINWNNIEVLSGATSKVVARIIGDTILEIAILAEIGGYDLYQSWQFDRAGRLRPFLYSSGWSCGWPFSRNEKDHKHHPYWRIDFDVESPANEIWQVEGNGHMRIQTIEDDRFRPSTNTSIAWTINRPGSNKHVLIRYPDNEVRDAGGTPWFSFSNKDAAYRLYKGSEDVGWEFSEERHLGYRQPREGINRQDIVFWVVGHLTHEWNLGDERHPMWHATGPIIEMVNF